MTQWIVFVGYLATLAVIGLFAFGALEIVPALLAVAAIGVFTLTYGAMATTQGQQRGVTNVINNTDDE